MQISLACLPLLNLTNSFPFNPHFNPYMTTAILETSFLTMSLKRHHLHAVSEIHDIYSLDFHLASGIWRVLKDLSRSIHEAPILRGPL